MIAKNMGDAFYIRIDSGEEIISSIKEFCHTHKVVSGMISGLGSVTEAELGLFDIDSKEYIRTEIQGIHEIASMNGNISRMDGDIYLHVHAVLSDPECRAFGGHFARGVVGATCEVIVTPYEFGANRIYDGEVGLNLLDI